jgi:general secretion pathway protein J
VSAERISGHASRVTHHDSRGFTLIEVLMAVTILSTLATLVYLSFTGTLRILEVVQEDGGRVRMARISLGLMAQELAMGRFQPSVPWIGRNADQEGRAADMLVLASTSHVRYRSNAPEADLIRVAYIREGDRLLRFSVRSLYDVTMDSIEQIELASGVLAFNVRYFDPVLLAWVDEWDGQTRTTLPTAVMIELTLENARKEAQVYREWVMIPVQSL